MRSIFNKKALRSRDINGNIEVFPHELKDHRECKNMLTVDIQSGEITHDERRENYWRI